MQTVNLCREFPYSALIPALKAIFTTRHGEKIELILMDRIVFGDLKTYLSEENIGFREIYEEDKLILQFTV